ncbi:MAG: hypothetical protein M3Q32_05100, partial [Pseudomonadota bacterium]|nr:hypothetical protein [Pseudomonadota bacterium]
MAALLRKKVRLEVGEFRAMGELSGRIVMELLDISFLLAGFASLIAPAPSAYKEEKSRLENWATGTLLRYARHGRFLSRWRAG